MMREKNDKVNYKYRQSGISSLLRMKMYNYIHLMVRMKYYLYNYYHCL